MSLLYIFSLYFYTINVQTSFGSLAYLITSLLILLDGHKQKLSFELKIQLVSIPLYSLVSGRKAIAYLLVV